METIRIPLTSLRYSIEPSEESEERGQSQGFGAPQASYIPLPAGQPTFLTLTESQIFGDNPVIVTCPTCRANTITKISYDIGNVTWMWSLLYGFFCGLCCIPFCLDSCKDVIHSCSICQSYIYRHIRPTC